MDAQVPEKLLPLYEEPGLREHYALYGGRGGAKSHGVAGAFAIHGHMREERFVCAREFQNSIKDSVKELLERKIKALGLSVYYSSTETEIVNKVTGSRFTFLGMNRNPDSAKSLEGCTFFWGEEAQTFSRRSLEIILPTVRAENSRFAWTWNPRFPTDPVDKMFRGPHIPEKSYVARLSYRDNPWFQQTRMPSERRRMLMSDPKRYPHVWEGEYDEDPDITIFSNIEMGRFDVPKNIDPRFGMDFGFSNDPNAIIKLYVVEEAQVIYIAAEAYAKRLPNRDLPDFVRSIPEARDYAIIADNSRPETIDYLTSSGLYVYPCKKGAGSIKNGITFMQGYKIIVSPDCPIFYEEIKNYRWKADPEGKPLPVPASGQKDHGIDAARYAIDELSTFDPDAVDEEDEVFFL